MQYHSQPAESARRVPYGDADLLPAYRAVGGHGHQLSAHAGRPGLCGDPDLDRVAIAVSATLPLLPGIAMSLLLAGRGHVSGRDLLYLWRRPVGRGAANCRAGDPLRNRASHSGRRIASSPTTASAARG